jgi:hypothetical protein
VDIVGPPLKVAPVKTNQIILKTIADIENGLSALERTHPDLILVFGALAFFESQDLMHALRRAAPDAIIAGCSTAGEIAVDRVYDNTCVVTSIHFDKTRVLMRSTPLNGMNDSFNAGERLAKALPADDLSIVMVFGVGVNINGSALVAGLQSNLPKNTTISGGLAADAGAFKQTWTLGPEGSTNDQIVVVGFYGENIRAGYGSFGGWEPFGPARKVTRSVENVLYELDGERALDIYKRYLGDHATGLPASGLLFPFEMLGKNQEKSRIYRTILGVNEDDGSLTLAGDIDPNGYLKLMHASTEKLIEGAETAAQQVVNSGHATSGDTLAVLVSCVGRKLVMGDRVDEEVEAVAELLGKSTTVTGFYSNGEIAGTEFYDKCHLHNQTMTITWMSEI